MQSENPREIAFELLQRWREGTVTADQLLEDALNRTSLTGADRGLLQEIFYGILRWQGTLDWLIGQKTKGRTQKPGLQTLLQVGLYQIFWLDRIPDHAAVNETVELARRRGFGAQAGFINAILRGYVREKDSTRQLLEQLKSSNPALGFSHPEWLVTRWREKFGEASSRQLLQWNNTPARAIARLNTLRASADILEQAWRDEGVAFERVDLPDHFPGRRSDLNFYTVQNTGTLTSLKSFQQGMFYMQDPSTALAVLALDPQPGQQILDLCSAPGGKATLMAQLTDNKASIMAQDKDPKRLQRVRENCERLGVSSVLTSRPSSVVFPELSVPYDRALIDAPCSNTGVLRRRIELRWRIQGSEIKRLSELQLQLLNETASSIADGGAMVYSTCSLESEENEGVVKKFLEGQDKWRLTWEGAVLPFRDGFDGAYAARLEKRNEIS